ncbi:MAG TPA: extensin family protein [Beijerinckiaceae bacterium]|jgi:hypothetical protein
MLVRTLLTRIGLALLLGLALVAGLVRAGAITIPDRINPFAPLQVADPPNALTRFKLGRLERDRDLCASTLRTSSLVYTPVPDQVTGEGCGFEAAVEVTRSSLAFDRPFRASCGLAAAWAMVEAHVLQQAARQHLGQPVVRIEHFGTYACRNLYHREGGRRSEHARANAIDIAAFVLADGTRVSVRQDWNADPKKAAFLRSVRDGACSFFDVVLSPDYNRAHHDHFHFDMGAFRACR